MKIVCISDTHRLHRQLVVPAGDILIHSGDFTTNGEESTVVDFNEWLGELPHPYKIVIAGNHDHGFQCQPTHYESLLTNAIYLNNSGITIKGITIWGSPMSPISPAFGTHGVYTIKRGQTIKTYWDQIPDDLDILVTHCPPFGILDQNEVGSNEGCRDLREIVKQRVSPRVHIFGHIHSGYGQVLIDDTMYINASSISLTGKLATNKLGKMMYRMAISLHLFRIFHLARHLLEKLEQNRSLMCLTASNPPIVVNLQQRLNERELGIDRSFKWHQANMATA